MTATAPRRQPTLDEVAARAGVSRSAASRVINQAPHVSHATREAVEKAVKEMGYRPNRTARALATRQTGIVALVISHDDPGLFADPFFAQVIVGVSAVLEETDLHLALCLASSERGRARLTGLLHARGVDGIMLMALDGDDPLTGIAEETGLPTVHGGRPLDSEPKWFVDSDNLGGARLATEHLLGLGRTRIVTITGPMTARVGASRLRGYQEALIMAGLSPYGTVEADFTEAGGAAAMTTLLARRPDLDAVFAASDKIAAGAIRVLNEAGRAVPEDVAVVGFDDLDVAERTDPPLTTVHQPIQALGREMTRMLLALIAGREPTALILPTRLVRRGSA
ncbi:LacI family DNA-binding transcriptional regulator [Actinoplanes couchii]|uniref:Transcriptional regulator n=1 Tax=Actinoplanes couchii TaxID=403638 RepID=A0ABQ3XLI6_9ACTN|nr:LacI family DNA-binding transcriptional regulator [Actinoplanes couchii]MDR6318265.1 DNA-binding LacI/PurR family transcriptional regulator [Actinoplanes couchii]GID59365.1 transcriptional regulator [Actinoplanes couchii]